MVIPTHRPTDHLSTDSNDNIHTTGADARLQPADGAGAGRARRHARDRTFLLGWLLTPNLPDGVVGRRTMIPTSTPTKPITSNQFQSTGRAGGGRRAVRDAHGAGAQPAQPHLFGRGCLGLHGRGLLVCMSGLLLREFGLI